MRAMEFRWMVERWRFSSWKEKRGAIFAEFAPSCATLD
jgi:hypothetical protein